MKDITYVIHIASPFPLVQPKDENEVITPAVEGTQAILKACVQAKSVKKVVMTSSSVAVHCKYNETIYYSSCKTQVRSSYFSAITKHSKTMGRVYCRNNSEI